jgi:hypothetical protein
VPKYTNRHNVHPAIADAVIYDPWSRRGDITVSELTKPPLMAFLEQSHDHEIEVDVSDRLFALLGQTTHEVLQRSRVENVLQEEPLAIELEGWTITGRPDILAGTTLTDFKVTSVWSFVFGDKPDWELQLNCYAVLYRHAGFDVDELEVAGILRDWQKRRAQESDDYPPSPFARLKVPLWPHEIALERMAGRVRQHQQARSGNPRYCSAEERWAKPDQWALMKVGQKRAMRLFDDLDAAVAFGGEKGGQAAGLSIEHRPGDQWVRCEGFCDVRSFCPMYAEAHGESIPVGQRSRPKVGR